MAETVKAKNGAIVASTDPDNMYALIRTEFGWKYLYSTDPVVRAGSYTKYGDEYTIQQIRAGREKVVFHPDKVI